MGKRISPVVSLLLPLFLLWLHQGSVDVKGDAAFVEHTCNKTPKPSFCVSLLLANSSSLNADLLGLAIISTGSLLSNATLSQPIVAELAQKATEPLLKTALTDCNSEYLLGIKDVKDALSFLAAKDFSSASTAALSTLQSASGCQDVFDEFKLTYPPILSRFHDSFLNITEVVESIINLRGGT